ncbi:MAG: hypothetical protein ABSG46_04550 [Candidatus Binataceae bacterium]|jgi:hypothetical protein
MPAGGSAVADERFIGKEYRHRAQADYPGLVAEVKAMLERGLATLENFLEPGFLSELQKSILPMAAKSYEGGTRRPLIGGALEGTLFYEVTFSRFLTQLVNDLLAGCQIHIEPSDAYPVLNILTGAGGQEQVKSWHFDATYLTVAMPVIVPDPARQADGKFRIWPNVRPFSQNRLLDRIWWNLAKLDVVRRSVRNFAVSLVPGNLYFFYGFRCYHGVDELDPNELRAVCLMNYGGPLFDRLKGKRMRYRH